MKSCVFSQDTLFIISAIIAWYAESALMLESAYKRPVLGLGKTTRQCSPDLGAGHG